MTIDQILSDFDVLDDWEERYRYIIDLGKKLPPLDSKLRNDGTKVRGCASQVWLHVSQDKSDPTRMHLNFVGDSDAMIVKGLIAVLFAIFDGKTPQDILAIDAKAILSRLGLDSNLSQQRSNGLAAMVERMRADALAALNNRH